MLAVVLYIFSPGWWSWLATIPVGSIDIYLSVVLFIGAVRSDAEQKHLKSDNADIDYKNYAKNMLPMRASGLIMVVLFFLTIVFSFAALYQTNEKDFCKSNAVMSTNAPASVATPLDKLDAVYFSVVTVATVGYGDITPITPTAKWLVTAEIVSGVLLLVGIVSFLISRIANFGSKTQPDTNAQAVTQQKKADVEAAISAVVKVATGKEPSPEITKNIKTIVDGMIPGP